MRSFQDNLDLYAKVAVRAGVNLQRGQRAVIRAPLEAAEFVRSLVRACYAEGAYAVHVAWNDEHVAGIRYRMASEASLSDVPAWVVSEVEEEVEARAAFITVMSPTPGVFEDVPPQRIATANRAARAATRRANQERHATCSWMALAAATPQWAAKVYPDVPAEEALGQLWRDVFRLCRVDREDPLGAWRDHAQELRRRRSHLQELDLRELHFSGPGTDLRVGLPKGHLWLGGQKENESGTPYIANIPTEEVFTLPQRDGVNGIVRATKPLNYLGVTIEGIRLELRAGEIVDFDADSGREVLRSVIETDEGSRRLGEVALVAQDSPVAQSGRVFYNTLYDENAACHIAIGMAFSYSLERGNEMSDAEFAAAGGNRSLTHVDFMIGSDALNVTGITRDGSAMPLLRQGRWAL